MMFQGKDNFWPLNFLLHRTTKQASSPNKIIKVKIAYTTGSRGGLQPNLIANRVRIVDLATDDCTGFHPGFESCIIIYPAPEKVPGPFSRRRRSVDGYPTPVLLSNLVTDSYDIRVNKLVSRYDMCFKFGGSYAER
ncbi:hypothetical protein NPIL_77801 [Nephila pilipes]|uniref:Uncharacterized protein n=1 Tax=Nephila pilipes TaxID=299642 RepID=A0A8X6QC04_NEPPI|nr:hypothetical protein NPIL_77801 [Nephila pilipes]